MGLIGYIIIGILAGYLAGKVMKGGGYGLLLNLLLGVAGGFVGGWLFGLVGISWGGIIGQLGTAVFGAIVVLWVASLLKR